MSRLSAALAALLLAAPALGAQDDKKPDAPEVDAKTRAAIQREVEKAKEDIRNEVRAEIQGAQSAAEFLGAVAEGPKLEFLQLDGYLRTRGQLLVNFSLTGGKRDASGRSLFPVPLQDPRGRDSLASANMRFRLEPTLNVSEHVRVRSQVDVYDNYVLGSSTSALFDDPGSPYPVPFYGSSRAVASDDPRADRPAIAPKRAWAEVQTPVGLLGFGRMPSEWGLGMLTHAGGGVDDDLGDTVDRVQFALPPVSTPIGRLTFVPILDFDAEGVLYRDPRAGSTAVGQPFDADSADDARTWALKVARLDTDDEIRRKHERNQTSVNFGAYYNYRTQKYFYPAWNTSGLDCTTGATPGCGDLGTTPATAVHRSAYAHIGDLWFRSLGPRLRIEAELALVFGQIGNAQASAAAAGERVQLRQWGGVLLADYQLTPSKVTLGAEVGAASGDSAPGFGNVPGRGQTAYGSLEGAQWGAGSDRSIRNFRFNPAYRVDLVLWRHVLGQVTDAFYVKPKLRWDILPGLRLDLAAVYSQALYRESTPSASANADGSVADRGSAPLGVELDTMLSYASGDGFQAWAQWGVLQPLKAFRYTSALDGEAKPGRAHLVAVGVAARF